MNNKDFTRWIFKEVGIYGTIIVMLGAMHVLLGRDIVRRVASVQDVRREIAGRSLSLRSLAILRADADQSQTLIGMLERALPTRDQLINFPQELNRLAENNNMEFSFRYETEVRASDTTPGVNNFTITASGSYDNFIRFLRSIEQSDYFVGFSSIEMTERAGEFDVVMRGRVYSR